MYNNYTQYLLSLYCTDLLIAYSSWFSCQRLSTPQHEVVVLLVHPHQAGKPVLGEKTKNVHKKTSIVVCILHVTDSASELWALNDSLFLREEKSMMPSLYHCIIARLPMVHNFNLHQLLLVCTWAVDRWSRARTVDRWERSGSTLNHTPPVKEEKREREKIIIIWERIVPYHVNHARMNGRVCGTLVQFGCYQHRNDA